MFTLVLIMSRLSSPVHMLLMLMPMLASLVRTSITVSPLTIIAFCIRCVFVLGTFVCGIKIEFLLQLVDGMNIKSDGIIVSRPLSSGNFL